MFVRDGEREGMAEPILSWILHGIPNPPKVRLFDDVGFIYEVQLARMELSSWWDRPDDFLTRAAYYEEINGKKTHHYFLSGIRGKGQIGRTNQYLVHWYYPYKAKFHPQMIKALINWMGLRMGERLLDPFVGSGTSLVESKLIGVDSIGIDIDPLCVLMSRVKTSLLDISPKEITSVELREAFDALHRRANSRSVGLERYIPTDRREEAGPLPQLEGPIYEFFLLSYLYALSDWTYVRKDMWRQFNRNVRSMVRCLELFEQLKERLSFSFGRVEVHHGDGRFPQNVGIGEGTIDGIVTSPPYSIAVDYIAQDLHAIRYLGIDPEKLQDKLVGLKGRGEERIEKYYEDMQIAFNNMYRVLRRGGYCCIIIGDVTYNGKKLPLSRRFIEMGREAGFEHVGTIRRPILGGFARLRYEYILLYQKK